MGIPELDTMTLKIAVHLSEWMHPHDLPFYIPPDSFSPRFGTQFFSMQCTGWDIITARDPESPTEAPNMMKMVVYIFKISRGRQENVVRIRYSEMLEFRNVLMSIPIIGGERVEGVHFPRKCYAPWNRYRACVLDERVSDFNAFLRGLFRLNLLFPGLKCVRNLFGFDHFDVVDEWWKETGYGKIRQNTFATPRVIRKKTNDSPLKDDDDKSDRRSSSSRKRGRMCSECAVSKHERMAFEKRRRRSAEFAGWAMA